MAEELTTLPRTRSCALSPEHSTRHPLVSFVIATHNRREALLNTLGILAAQSSTAASEVLVVDNASGDGTCPAVRREFPAVRLFPQSVNAGPCAKNIAIAAARAQYIVFLDDDSYPDPGAIDRMVEKFAADPKLGAAIFAVRLSGGGEECSAYPQVFAGCGVGLRAAAIAQVGGLPEDFFMAAEEYDLALRLLDGGWHIQRFEDLRVTHLKTPQARFPSRIMQLDVRNNLTLIGRYFPDEWVIPFAMDWARRYRMIAQVHHRAPAYYGGLAAGITRLLRGEGRRPVTPATFEAFAKLDEIERRMTAAKSRFNLKRLLFVDLGKNMLPYWRAARRRGLTVAAVADAKLAGQGFSYRGAPIISDDAAAKLRFDGVVISNLSPVHARQRREFWRQKTDLPVIDLFEAA